ncbi:hypothetical protein RI367_000946 [Sorochytrium milnesiophthora]
MAVVATSRVSRFHTETLDTTSNEVLLHDVNMTINNVEFISGAKLWLKAGTHYTFIARNGAGKSTLMKTIAEGNLIGFPAGMRVMYVSQQFEADDRTPLEVLLDTDEEHSVIAYQVEELEMAVSDPTHHMDTLRGYVVDEAEAEAEKNNKIATHRSGKRGKVARTVALESEHKVARVKSANMSQEEVLTRANDILYNEHERKLHAEKVLTGLRFTPEMQKTPFSSLSGGWQVRVLLAQSLFAESDLLMLDEPTNHLDLPAILWLQRYVQELPQTVLVVSHDRAFLDAVADETIFLKDNYGEAESIKEETRANKQRQLDAMERKKKHIEASIAKATQQAKSGGDDKKLGMVASRKKKLERLGMEKTEDGKRFKQSYRAGHHLDSRPQIVVERPEAPVTFKLDDPVPPRQHGNVLEMSNVWHSYAGKNGPWILQDITFTLEWGQKFAIVGANGAGKSTLVGVITSTLTPTKGTAKVASAIKVGYFSQQQIDEAFTGSEITPVEHLRVAAPTMSLADIHARLGSFNIPGRLFNTPVRTMSGGERVKLALAKALIGDPQLLVLDEPTNHLDILSIEGLAEAVSKYSGSIVLVSHDRWFVQKVAERVYWLNKGALTRLDDGMAELERRWSKRLKL